MAPNIRSRSLTNSSLSGTGAVPFTFPPGKKKLLVFFDGTSNQWDTRTNVRRLFEMIGGQEDPQRLCFYVEGVGADYQGVIGNAFGQGMQKRIAKAYAFLSEYYNADEKDEIYIFGFSRGALQARALAGLIAHCGLMFPQRESESVMRWRATEMIKWCGKTCEGNSVEDWNEAQQNQEPLYPKYLRCDSALTNTFPYTTRYAEIKFLGVWDTVPGSSFKDFGPTEEMEDWNAGIRYKLGAYPPIREIAHAVSLNERRKQFRPVLIPSPVPITGRRTVLHEEWFSGAHSDVGGGYQDSSELSGITLNWMLSFLSEDELFSGVNPRVANNILGPQHDQWSRSFFWRLWDPQDRWRPANAIVNGSVAERIAGGPIVVESGHDQWQSVNYQIPENGRRPSVWAGGYSKEISTSIISPGMATPVSSNEFRILPWQPWNQTGYQLEANQKYLITAVAEMDDNGELYKDSSIPATPDGIKGARGLFFDFTKRNPHFYNLAKWLGPGRNTRLRVLHDQAGKRAKFLTVIGAIGLDDRECNVFVIGKESQIVPKRSGELVVFCNDWPGGCGDKGDQRFSNSATYANNTGRIRLTIKRL